MDGVLESLLVEQELTTTFFGGVGQIGVNKWAPPECHKILTSS